MLNWEQNQNFITYDPILFDYLGIIINNVTSEDYSSDNMAIPKELKNYLQSIHFNINVAEIKNRSKSSQSFANNFFNWFR